MTTESFTCADCGTPVVKIVWGPPFDGLCAECRIIREAKPEDQATLRKIFKKGTAPE